MATKNNKKKWNESGRSMIETLGVLVLLILLTLGGIQVFGLLYTSVVAKAVTESVVNQASVRRHEHMKRMPEGTNEVDLKGPYGYPIHVEDGVTGSLKNTFWVSVNLVKSQYQKKLCDKLMARGNELLTKQASYSESTGGGEHWLGMIEIVVDGKVVTECTEKVEEVKYLFAKRGGAEGVTEINLCNGDCCGLCPTGGNCAGGNLECMPGYRQVAGGLCGYDTCRKCTGRECCDPSCSGDECAEGTKPNEVHTRCPDCTVDDDPEECGCPEGLMPNGKGGCGCSEDDECRKCYKCDTATQKCEERASNEECPDCTDPEKKCYDYVKKECAKCVDPCLTNRECTNCERCGDNGRCKPATPCPTSCSGDGDCGKCQKCDDEECKEIEAKNEPCPDCPPETPCWDADKDECIECKTPCASNKDCLNCEACGEDNYCYTTPECPQPCTAEEDCAKCQNCEGSICVEMDNTNVCPDCPASKPCWNKDTDECVSCSCTIDSNCPTSQSCIGQICRCVAGSVINEEGICSSCLINTYMSEDGTECIPCDTENGYYSAAGSTACLKCGIPLVSTAAGLECPCSQAMLDAGFKEGEGSSKFVYADNTITYTGTMTVSKDLFLGSCNLVVNGNLSVNTGKKLKTMGNITATSTTSTTALYNAGTIYAHDIVATGGTGRAIYTTGSINAVTISAVGPKEAIYLYEPGSISANTVAATTSGTSNALYMGSKTSLRAENVTATGKETALNVYGTISAPQINAKGGGKIYLSGVMNVDYLTVNWPENGSSESVPAEAGGAYAYLSLSSSTAGTKLQPFTEGVHGHIKVHGYITNSGSSIKTWDIEVINPRENYAALSVSGANAFVEANRIDLADTAGTSKYGLKISTTTAKIQADEIYANNFSEYCLQAYTGTVKVKNSLTLNNCAGRGIDMGYGSTSSSISGTIDVGEDIIIIGDKNVIGEATINDNGSSVNWGIYSNSGTTITARNIVVDGYVHGIRERGTIKTTEDIRVDAIERAMPDSTYGLNLTARDLILNTTNKKQASASVELAGTVNVERAITITGDGSTPASGNDYTFAAFYSGTMTATSLSVIDRITRSSDPEASLGRNHTAFKVGNADAHVIISGPITVTAQNYSLIKFVDYREAGAYSGSTALHVDKGYTDAYRYIVKGTLYDIYTQNQNSDLNVIYRAPPEGGDYPPITYSGSARCKICARGGSKTANSMPNYGYPGSVEGHQPRTSYACDKSETDQYLCNNSTSCWNCVSNGEY